jgi:hypothetical protein
MKAAGFILIALFLVSGRPASASGQVRIQQSDGSIKTYTGVTMKVANNALTLISPDKVTTVKINAANCTHSGDLVSCSATSISFTQDGQTHAVPFKVATFYFNPTNQEQQLALSTTKIAAHSVLFAVQTAKGTVINGDGKLDEEPAP